MSLHSPKAKYRAEINYSKPIAGLGSVESYTGDNKDMLVAMTISTAQSRKTPFAINVYENKSTYPDFDWVLIETIK